MRTDKHKIYVHHRAKQHAGGTVSNGAIEHFHSGNGKFWNNKKRPKVTARAGRWNWVTLSCGIDLCQMHSDWLTNVKEFTTKARYKKIALTVFHFEKRASQ